MPSPLVIMEFNSPRYKTICLPFPSEAAYRKLSAIGNTFRNHLDELLAQYPELFPSEIANGYWLHGSVYSKKLDIITRRIKLVTNQSVYQIRPEFLLPYMVEMSDEVEKAMYLRKFGVPFEALTYVFGHDPSYWYRLYQGLGRHSIVGTTVKNPDTIPVNLTADEKHSWLLGERVYIPTTVGANCFLGVDIVESAETPDLVKGYGVFREEALNLNPDYQTETVTLDGWEQSHCAWQLLFSGVEIILCFLHSVLNIQKRCRKNKTLWKKLTGRLWYTYKSPTKRHFAQRLGRLRE